MKIAYIGSFQRMWDEEERARSFEELEHEVLRFEEASFDTSKLRGLISEHPDFVIFPKLRVSCREEVIPRLKKEGIVSVCWVPDLYFGMNRENLVRNRDPIFQADYVCTPDGGNDEKWKQYGINHHVVRQGVYQKETKLLELPKKFDVVFVGSIYSETSYRIHLINFLNKNYSFRWFGSRNPNQKRGMDLNELFGETKIVIGDSKYSPHYWSNRVYETMGRGGFLLHPKVEGLEKEFQYYKHLIPFSYADMKALKEKIDYYLGHEEERERIRKAGHVYCKKNHTYLQRCQQIISIVKNTGTDA